MRRWLPLIILIFAFFIRVFPLLDNHFYFTIDQGRDAIYIRSLLSGRLPLLGPETDIAHLYHGVLWYYLLAPFYFLFGGHPFGAIFFLILLTCFIFFLLWQNLTKILSPRVLLITLAILTFFLPLYETTRFAFNPYFMAQIAMLFLIGLTFTYQNPKFFLLAALATGMVLHSELASLIIFLITFAIAGVALLREKKINRFFFLAGWFIVFVLFLPHIVSEFTTNFSQLWALANHLSGSESILRVSTLSQLEIVAGLLFSYLGESVLPQNPTLGGILFFVFLFVYLFKKRKKASPWVIYSSILTLLTLFWFGTNRGFRNWHLVYIPPLALISLVIFLSLLPRKISLIILSVIFLLQLAHTTSAIREYWQNREDPGFLDNQLKTLDWIYTQNLNQGFSVYTYVPSVLDYHYQYLFPWYGLKKYGFLPCEFTTNPGVDPGLYIPDSQNYKEAKRFCSKKFFLILEPAVVPELRQRWYEEVKRNSKIITQTVIGQIEVEERERISR